VAWTTVVSELQQIIRNEIDASGPMSFRRFMELALYHPKLGYYEKSLTQTGREGDFFTSVSVGALFGKLLASRFAEWLAEDESLTRIVEAGAHDGTLARDVLETLPKEIRDRIVYCIIEPSVTRRARQQAMLMKLFNNVSWFASWEELQSECGRVRGIIHSNELLDAFPVEAYEWSRSEGAWRERGVCKGENGLVECLLQGAANPFGNSIPEKLLGLLPNGFRVEKSAMASEWHSKAAKALERGRLVSIDYGDRLEEQLDPGRAQGTLRGYRKHRLAVDVLADPGEQDITAHVDWSEIEAAGESAGLRPIELEKQGLFLTRAFKDAFERSPEEWNLNPKEVRMFQTLTQPDQLGSRFQVLVQERR
tara:strand:+ start:5716 stop:6810 length:1095 start_codon:yes stop_codon:yes gene_type:complete